MAGIHITDVESAINWWRGRKPSFDGITAFSTGAGFGCTDTSGGATMFVGTGLSATGVLCAGRRVGTTTFALFSVMWASSRQTNSLTRSARSVQDALT